MGPDVLGVIHRTHANKRSTRLRLHSLSPSSTPNATVLGELRPCSDVFSAGTSSSDISDYLKLAECSRTSTKSVCLSLSRGKGQTVTLGTCSFRTWPSVVRRNADADLTPASDARPPGLQRSFSTTVERVTGGRGSITSSSCCLPGIALGCLIRALVLSGFSP